MKVQEIDKYFLRILKCSFIDNSATRIINNVREIIDSNHIVLNICLDYEESYSVDQNSLDYYLRVTSVDYGKL